MIANILITTLISEWRKVAGASLGRCNGPTPGHAETHVTTRGRPRDER